MTETDTIDYTDDSFQLNDNIEDFNSMQPPILPIDKDYHIFISYKSISPDCETADRIDTFLSKKGYKCCLYEREFLPGERKVDKIDKSIQRSIKAVFLLSENSKSNEWCQYELTWTKTINIQNKGYKPIILKLDDCDVPDVMRPYTNIDVNGPIDSWIGKLGKAINDQTDYLISSRKNIKFVAVPCIDYNRDMDHSVESCRYPHVCAKHIIGDESCDENTCTKNHNLVTDQSRDILADLGFIADGNYNSLLQTYSRKCRKKLNTTPHDIVTGPCCYYNYKGCMLGELHCPYTHICKGWFLGSCLNENCEWSHNILNKQTKRLLQIFKIDTNQPNDVILANYREIYPHKKFLSLPNTATPRAQHFGEKWMFLVGSVILATALVVNKLRRIN